MTDLRSGVVDLCAAGVGDALAAIERDGFPFPVPADREERTARYRQQADRDRSLAAEWLLQTMLAGRCGADFSYDVFRDDLGRPVLTEPDGPTFSLSHAGDQVLCGMSDAEIGVDVERVRPFREGLPNRFFAPEELAAYHGAEDTADTFFRIWTLKESCMKAVGQGIRLGTKTFSVTIQDDGSANVSGLAAGRWHLRSYPVIDSHYFAAAARDPLPERILTLDPLGDPGRATR